MEAKKQGENTEDLSMEDILQSIRKIIADEGDEASPASAPEASANSAAGSSDILELTDMIEDDGTITNIKEPSPTADVLSSIDSVLAAEKPELAPGPEIPEIVMPELVLPEKPPEAIELVADDMPEEDVVDSLLSKTAEEAAISALDKLKTSGYMPQVPHPPSPVFRSGTTVEDMVADMLKPMMKQWLDDNLPDIVERIVEREVMRLTRR